MSKSKLLSDDFYTKQLQRMSGLQGFPLVPAALAELKRALRQASEKDEKFIHRLVTQFVDDASGKCPKPGQLLALAGQWRQQQVKLAGDPDCPQCHGSGWVSSKKPVKVPGLQTYEAESSERCRCCTPPRQEYSV